MGRISVARLGVGLAALAGVAWAQTAATDAPARYQGLYLKSDGGTETMNCGTNSIFATSSNFAGCCSIGGNCNFPIGCTGRTATNRRGAKWICSQDLTCYRMTVIGDHASPTQSVLVHNCARDWVASTIYRRMEAEATTSTTASPGASAAPSDSSTATDSATPSGTGASDGGQDPAPEQTQTAAVTAAPSRAWIAGVAVGVFVGLVAIGVLGFCIGRKRRARKQQQWNAGPLEEGEHGKSGGGGGGGGVNRKHHQFRLISALHIRSGGAGTPRRWGRAHGCSPSPSSAPIAVGNSNNSIDAAYRAVPHGGKFPFAGGGGQHMMYQYQYPNQNQGGPVEIGGDNSTAAAVEMEGDLGQRGHPPALSQHHNHNQSYHRRESPTVPSAVAAAVAPYHDGQNGKPPLAETGEARDVDNQHAAGARSPLEMAAGGDHFELEGDSHSGHSEMVPAAREKSLL